MLIHVNTGKAYLSAKLQAARPSAPEPERYREMVETTSDWVWEVDLDGRYTYASPKVTEILGYRVDEVVGRTPFEFMPPAEATRVGAEFLEIVSARTAFHELINSNLHRDGREVILESSGVPIFDAHGELRGYRGIDRDVTSREQTLRRLRLADAAVQNSGEGIIVADAHGNITASNPAFVAMSGYSEAQLVGSPPSMLSASADPRQRLWDLIGKAPRWSGEGVCRHREAEAFSVWMTLSAVHHGSRVSGYVALISDMTERKLAEATIRFQASHDALTQLANRSSWLNSLKRALHEAQSTEDQVAVLFVDLDGFKAANDRYGHGVGDILLSTTARRLERCVRRTDLVARFGGDEFTIMLRGLNGKHAPERVARACVDALQVPFRIDGNDVRISASIGVAVFPTHGKSVDGLVAAADRAMYVAKRAGGSRVHLIGTPLPKTSKLAKAPKASKPKVRASGAAGKRATKAPAARARTASRR